jgi:hypothetical protein
MRVRFAVGPLLLLATTCIHAASTSDTGFALHDEPGKYLDVLLDGRPVARYMYQFDNSTPQRFHETYKPYLHVFDADGKAPITKGPGGEFSHHRGIFIGWNKIVFQGKVYDRWHMAGGAIVHRKFLDETADSNQASFTSLTTWDGPDRKPLIEEQRTMVFRRAPAPGRLMIDFTAKLTAASGDILLDGDPEHAGIQYRPANEVDRKQTLYVFPKEHADAKKDLDYPWVGETYTLGGKRYSVIDMNHPGNPKNTKFSAYRNYGRFGAYFVQPIKAGKSLTVRYRFLIADGEMPSIAMIQRCWDEFAGAASPTSIPQTTVRAAD